MIRWADLSSPAVVKESTAAIVTKLGRSPVGRRLFKKRAKTNVLTQLRSGVTTIRTVGDVAYEVVEVADEIERGACSPWRYGTTPGRAPVIGRSAPRSRPAAAS